jgi:hypothetical protein
MKKLIVLFGIGAFGYGLIEVCWRGYSHWSMMLAGGIIFVIFSFIDQKFSKLHILYKCILGSLTVTLTELVFGSVFNLMLGMKVWDYSKIPLNLSGQICLLFSVLWGFLSFIAIPFAGAASKRLSAKNQYKPYEGSNVYGLSAQGLGRD